MKSPEEKAREIVQQIYDRLEFNKQVHGDAMFHAGEAIAAIAQALKDAVVWPSGKEIKAAAEKEMKSDHCQAAFYKGARWLKARVERGNNDAT